MHLFMITYPCDSSCVDTFHIRIYLEQPFIGIEIRKMEVKTQVLDNLEYLEKEVRIYSLESVAHT
jgi:hypothetical protein